MTQPAPSDLHHYRGIGSVTRCENALSFESHRGGMQTHYLARWVTRRGTMRPWSQTSTATVAA